MKHLNFVLVLGYIGVKPTYVKLKNSKNNIRYAQAKVVTERHYMNKNNQYTVESLSHKIIAWQDMADVLGNLQYGYLVKIIGHLNSTANNSTIICEEISIIDTKPR